MKKHLFLAISSLFALTTLLSNQPSIPKKKITIITCGGKGAGGGEAAFEKGMLPDLTKYEVNSVYFLNNIVNDTDFLHILTGGKHHSQELYAIAQKNRLFGLMDAIYTMTEGFTPIMYDAYHKRTINFLKNDNPDLVISLFPTINNVISDCCQELDIPLLIMPSNFSPYTYIREMKAPYYEKMYIALSVDHPMIQKELEKKKVPESNVLTCKFPLQPDFLEAKNKKQIKKDFDITDEKPVIMLMMGAQGGDGNYTFSKELSSIKSDAHLIICIGKQTEIKQKIESIDFPNHITPHVIGYTDRISDLMAISDILISKTGALTTAESLHMRLPLIADQTEGAVSWERFHQDFLEKTKTGIVLRKKEHLAWFVDNLLLKPYKLEKLKANIDIFLETQSKTNIKDIIKQII